MQRQKQVFSRKRKLNVHKTDSFDIFCTDIVYTSEVKNNGKKMKITCNGENMTIDKHWLDSDEIFSKKYEWRYESESRIVIKFSDAVQKKIKRYKEEIEEENKKDKEGCKNAYLVIKLCVPKYRRIKEERVIRSPVYKGNISFGIDSALLNEIQW